MITKHIATYAALGLVLGAFLAISLFGTFIMVREAGHDGCLASRASGTSCPLTGGLFAYANFHLNAAKTFSTGLVAALILIGAAALVATAAGADRPHTVPRYARAHLRALSRTLALASFYRLTRWLSLKELSPSVR